MAALTAAAPSRAQTTPAGATGLDEIVVTAQKRTAAIEEVPLAVSVLGGEDADRDAPFKVLVSGSGWNDGKAEGADSWASFTHERDAVLGEAMKDGVEGIVLLSGDTHFGELNCLPWSQRGGYDLYEFVSSPLAQDTVDLYLTGRPVMRVRQAFSGDVNFGLVDFDLSKTDPTVRFELRDEGGQAVWPAMQLTGSQLRKGVHSWPAKLDSVSAQRWARSQAGGSYY